MIIELHSENYIFLNNLASFLTINSLRPSDAYMRQ